MGAELAIRRYEPADRERVEEVMRRAVRDAGAFLGEGPDDEADSLAAEYLESDGEFLVGEVDGRIVATGAFRPVAGLVADVLDAVPDDAIEIKRMHVAPAHQRRGYGGQILTELHRRARARGRTEVLLETTSLQRAAQRFYEANGFTEIAREPVQAAGESFDLVFYRKSLAD